MEINSTDRNDFFYDVISKSEMAPVGNRIETLTEFLSQPWLSITGRAERLNAIDSLDVEMIYFLLWTLGKTDVSASSIIVYPKNGLIYKVPIYGLNLIDPDLTVSEQPFLSQLFPHITTLSPKTVDKIMHFPSEKTNEHIKQLQSFVSENLSIQEINRRFNILPPISSVWLKV
ncbi:MAG: hypothetical protein ABSA17_03030 [Rhabdochlamydiaceae bacterium]|jgi:hypothetical protein